MERRRNTTFRQLELSTLLESMPEAVLIFDEHGMVTEVNSAAERLLGLRGDEMRGKSLAELAQAIVPQRDGVPLQVEKFAVSRALRGDEVPREERMFMLNGEKKVEVIISAHPIRRGGELVGALLVVRDVSEVKFLQRRLADTANHLAIGQMAADIAHDFSNVLSTISQAASVLQALESAPAAERRSYLGMIQNSVRRGMEIIQRMSEYIRGGKGERTELGIAQLLGEALDLTRPLIARRKNINVHTELCPAVVMGNAADLRRSFANLILNAVEAMPEGGTLTVRCGESRGRVCVEVADTGTGIAPHDQKKIFSPYFTTKPEGTGLGLVGARHIFEEHGGKIRFRSELGKGTEFTIELPEGGRAKESVA